MTGILKVDTIQNSGGTTGLEIDSSGRVAMSQQEMFRRADGTLITRPHFRAAKANATYDHTFSSNSNPSSFGDTSSSLAFPNYSVVTGNNTTGFTTSNNVGEAKYQVPVTGIYMFAFQHLMTTAAAAHIDTAFFITDKDDTFSDIASLRPWMTQASTFTSNTQHGVVGFTRFDPANAAQNAHGCTVIVELYEGQHVRPVIHMNSSQTLGIYGASPNYHNYYHGTLIGT